jgi:hypothetical protein
MRITENELFNYEEQARSVDSEKKGEGERKAKRASEQAHKIYI